MPRATPAVPRYCHHKKSDRAFVKVGGKFRYLGKWNSPESREAYARLVRDIAVNGAALAIAPATTEPSDGLSVAVVLARFWDHAKRVYPYDPAHDGRRPPGEIGNFWDAMRPLVKLYGTSPAVDFGPRALSLVQDEMIAMGWCRNVVNRHTIRVRSIFKWACGPAELLPGEVHYRLMAVRGLRKGHRGVRETAKVQPVDEAVLNATLAHCSPRIAAMIKVQLYTGMRSGNLVTMRTADVDRSRPAKFKARPGPDGKPRRWNWRYKPRTHKTEHHGHALVIRLGPRARKALRPYLKPENPEAFVFSPAEEMAEVRAARTAARTTPASCGNKVGTKKKRTPKRTPGQRYTPGSYAAAINRACDRADRWAKGGMIIANEDRAVPRWHPHQLRHNKGTAVRAKHGVDGVLAALGQRTAAMADRYAEIEAEKAERVAVETG